MPQRLDLRLMARILDARATMSERVVISRPMARRLAQLCRDIAWQEEEAA